jgi:outer membrane lipopolysaccharide assembly protein LptE/RlpB
MSAGMRRLTDLFAAAAAAVLAIALSGCGYHLAAAGDALPPNAKTIYVERFSNSTRFTGANDELMRYIKDEIAMHDRLQEVDSASQADLILSGNIESIYTLPTAYNSVLEPTIYGVSMSVTAQLKDVKQNKIIWQAHGINNSQNAQVVAQTVVTTTPTFQQQNLRGSDIAKMQDIQVAQTQNAAARDQMMQQVAKNLYAEMAEGF